MRYPGKLPVNYDSDNKPGKILAPGKPAQAKVGKQLGVFCLDPKAASLNTPIMAKPGKETFAIQELSFIDDPVNNVGGVKGMFSLDKTSQKKAISSKDKDVDALL